MTTDNLTDEELFLVSAFTENAAHEAGHAVIGHVLGLEVNSIEVYQDRQEGGGAVWFAEQDPKEERVAIMTAAGAEAVAFFQDQIRDHNRRARISGGEEEPHVFTQWPDLSEDDERMIARYLSSNYFSGRSNRQREYNRIRAEARRLLDQHNAAIAAVAVALVDASEGLSSGKLDRAAFLGAIDGKV